MRRLLAYAALTGAWRRARCSSWAPLFSNWWAAGHGGGLRPLHQPGAAGGPDFGAPVWVSEALRARRGGLGARRCGGCTAARIYLRTWSSRSCCSTARATSSSSWGSTSCATCGGDLRPPPTPAAGVLRPQSHRPPGDPGHHRRRRAERDVHGRHRHDVRRHHGALAASSGCCSGWTGGWPWWLSRSCRCCCSHLLVQDQGADSFRDVRVKIARISAFLQEHLTGMSVCSSSAGRGGPTASSRRSTRPPRRQRALDLLLRGVLPRGGADHRARSGPADLGRRGPGGHGGASRWAP